MSRTRAVQRSDTSGNRADVARSLNKLMRAFNRRRCWCGNPATSVRPGSDEVREGPTSVLLCRAVADENLCLDHCFVEARKAA